MIGKRVTFARGQRLSSGWQALGTWTGTAGLPPLAVSVTPNSGTGANHSFTLLYFDSNGYTDLNITYANLFYLVDDPGAALLGPISPGAGSLSNSQCTLNGVGSSPAGSGNNLNVTISLSFKPAFAGLRNIYGLAADSTGLDSGWQLLGTWTGQ